MEKKAKAPKKKAKYLKPCLTKHRKLKDITAGQTMVTILGCSRLFS
jgi:hypothetical protein